MTGGLWPVAGALALAVGLGGTAGAATPADIVIGKDVFPESISAGPTGSLYVGSVNGGVLRVSPGGKVTQWIAPGAYDTRSIFGVLVDAAHQTVWVCSNDLSAIGIAGPGNQPGSWLKAFDLATGRGKARYTMPRDKAFCNDMAVAVDGTLYVTATGPDVMRLKPGATTLELWVNDSRIQPAHAGGADGIAFGADGNLYVTSIGSGLLFRIAIDKDGSGQVTQLNVDRALVRPDGMRPIGGDSFVLIEGGGRVDRVDISGDDAKITPLKDGLDGPTGVAPIGETAWYVEGRLNWLFDPANRSKSLATPFRISAVAIR